MTNVAANAQVLVIDAMCLSYFARAERFDVFRDLLVDKECWTTRVVLEEVRQGAAGYPALEVVFDADWLSVVELDSLDEIRRFAIWVQRLGSGERDLGEASVLAAAEPGTRHPSLTTERPSESLEPTVRKSTEPYGCSAAPATRANRPMLRRPT